jgi:hypothetical protein
MEAATSRSGATARTADRSRGLSRRLSTETKQSTKTSEFWAYVAVVVGILASAALIKGGDTAPGTDEFIANQAWLYVAIVTGAYIIGRGLAKSGSREPYDENRGNDGGHNS